MAIAGSFEQQLAMIDALRDLAQRAQGGGDSICGAGGLLVMRYSIRISRPWAPLFHLFGFRTDSSYVELSDDALTFSFGTAHETIPLLDVESVSPRAWPLIYGLGAKLGPDGGVAYVGSREGVVQVRFARPHTMNVWGPFARRASQAATVSLDQPDAFIEALTERLQEQAAAPATQPQLVMTPKLQQAIKRLQMSPLELQALIHEEVLENPAIANAPETVEPGPDSRNGGDAQSKVATIDGVSAAADEIPAAVANDREKKTEEHD